MMEETKSPHFKRGVIWLLDGLIKLADGGMLDITETGELRINGTKVEATAQQINALNELLNANGDIETAHTINILPGGALQFDGEPITATAQQLNALAGLINASGHIELTDTVWVDVDFPIIIRTTGAGIPSLTTFNGRLKMPQWQVNDANEFESQEFIHGWKEGSRGYWHAHLNTNGLDATDRYVRFELEFGYTGANGLWVFPAVVDTGDLLIPANTPSKTQIIFPLANFLPADTKIAGHAIAYLKRIAATGAAPTNDPWIPMLQMHVECNTWGSNEIITK